MTMRTRPLLVTAVTATLALVASLVGFAPGARAAHAEARIHPGVQVDIDHRDGGGQCTANFVFTDGTSTYLGMAAHCAGAGSDPFATDGCDAESLPLGTEVDIDGASRPGTLAYSSWLAMQQANETDPETCANNDFALVRVDPADVAKVDPTVPHWGGPVALATTGPAFGEDAYSYGNSSLRLGISLLSPKVGTSFGTTDDGWSHGVYTVTPGVPGDSGSGFLDAQGRAYGTLSTVEFAPVAGRNHLGDLAKELAYAASHVPGVRLEPGRRPFEPGLPL